MPLLPLLIALLGAVTLLSLIARASWPMELLQHFRPHLIAAGLLGAILCLALDFQWEWALISLGLALVNYAAMPARAWLKPDAHLEKQNGLTIVWANVWQREKPLRRTLDWAKAQNADLILITEFPNLDPAAVLPGEYLHRLDTGLSETTGHFTTRLVAFSRMALDQTEIRPGPGSNHRPWLTFSIAVGAERLNVAAVHPVPPNTPKLLKERTDHIALLPAALREPFVLAGDFNATPWCPGYAAIPGRRVGAYQWKPTWFTDLPLLGLPIDHIMVSAGLKASLYKVSPFFGSDHRAVLVRVHPPGRVGGP